MLPFASMSLAAAGSVSGTTVASLDFKTGSYTLAGSTTSTLSSVSGYTFSRASTRVEAQPGTALLSFSSNAPAEVSGVGLWQRGAQTNSVPRSLTIGGTGWAATSMTVTTGQSDPTGGTSAVKLTTTSAGDATSNVSLSASVNISAYPAAYAVIAKADTSNFLWMQINSGTNSAGVTFDLSSGSAGTPFLLAGSLSQLGNPTAHIVSLGSGFYLCGVWADIPLATPTVNLYMGPADAAGSRSHSSSKAVIVYNAQIIADPNAVSFSRPQIITTSGSAVTTAADNLYFTSTPVGDEDFFFYAVINMDALIERDRVVARLSDGTDSNRIQLQLSSLHKPVVQITNSGSNTSLTHVATGGVGTVAIGVRRKSGKYMSIFKAAGTTTLGTESGTVAMPTYDRIEVGSTAGTNNLFAAIEKVQIRTGTFSDADLTTIFSAL